MIFRRKPKPEPAHPAADRAIEEANKHYDEVEARAEEVHDLAKEMKRIQKRNHFAERVEAIMEGENYRDK